MPPSLECTDTPTCASRAPLIEIRNISKAFGGVQALAGVSLDIAAGEVHALCGENGAGKSTLIKILGGSVLPDAGSVLVSGQPLALGDVRASEAAGIAVIHQDPIAFPHLTAAENVFAGREVRRFGGVTLDRRVMRRRTGELLAQLGERIGQRVPVGELTLAQRQMVAIARALSQQCRLLIMDEPTSSFSARETDVLFRIIRRLRSEGVSVLYVSHRLEEVFALADRVSVLRDGRAVGTCPIADIDRGGLIRLMVGREATGLVARDVTTAPAGTPLLDVRGLTSAGVFHDISLAVRAGEIVGLAGLVGAGRSELARAIFGVDCYDSGEIDVAGRPLPGGSIGAAMRAGLVLVPEDRQHQGLILPMSLGANVTLALLRSLVQGGLLSSRRERDVAERTIRDLAIVAPGPRAKAWTLSGGNQQKLLLGKWLAAQPRVLILDEPTRGVDVGAKEEVHRLILRLAEQGMATLLISSDLPEVLALSDRVVVMRGGSIAGELPRDAATPESVAALAVPGASAPATPGDFVAETQKSTSSPPRRQSGAMRVVSWLLRRREACVALLLLLTIGIVAGRNPAFLSWNSASDVLVQCVPAAIVGCGLTLVIVTGEIDISVGSLMALLAAILGLLASPEHANWPVPAAVGVTLAAGAAVGLINGVLVSLARVPSIIVTLGMLTILRGITELLMGGEWITHLPAGLRLLGTGSFVGIPISVWTAAAVILGAMFLARRTPLGLRIYAVGSNPQAARLAGLPRRRLVVLVFMLTGLLTAVATVVTVPQLSVIESGVGVGFELLVVTCVLVGGTSIRGGLGTILGTTLAVLLLGIVRTALVYLKLGEMATYWERAIQGIFILAAVLGDHLARRARSARSSGALE